MPSSSANPLFTTSIFIAANRPYPAHPRIDPQCYMPFTLLTNPGGDYSIRFSNSATDQPVRVYLMAFVTDHLNATWSSASLLLDPNFISQPHERPLFFNKAELNGATNLWIGCWWDDGSYATAAAYFADHPSDPNHHTVPITTG